MNEKMGFAPNSGEVEKKDGETTVLATTGLWRLLRRVKNETNSKTDGEVGAAEDLGENLDDIPEDESEDDGWEDYYDDEDDWSEHLERREDEMELWQMEIPEHILRKYDFIKELPEGIGVMGGVARSIAREIITGEVEPIRDIDLVEIAEEDESGVDEATKDALAREFMPDDYQHGHGIRKEGLEYYFKTRDLTVNQCLVMGQKLIVSDLAYDDFKENIIRPTAYELPFEGEQVSSRLFLRALVMRATVEQFSESVPLLEDVDIDPYNVRSFDMAVTLNKAMSRGVIVAKTLTEDFADWDLIPGELAGKPMEVAVNLLEDVWGFEFRASSDERVSSNRNNEMDTSESAVQRIMRVYQPQSSAMRREMELYSEHPEGIGLTERESEYYTESDFQEINRIARERLRESGVIVA